MTRQPPDKIEPHGLYHSADVARLVLGHDVEWFYHYRHHAGLAEGFPKPVSPSGQPRWRGSCLLAWMERPDRGTPSLPLLDSLEGPNIVDIRSTLRQRSQAMAQRTARRLSQSKA